MKYGRQEVNKAFLFTLKNLLLTPKISIMINYSIYLQTCTLRPEDPAKAYAKAQMTELMSFKDFVQHISDHHGVYTRGTVRGVLLDMCECLVEMLLDGKKVQLGEFGNFWVSLNSDGADSAAEFTAANITDVNIVFTPGEDFENLRGRAKFNVVASRAGQAAMLAAEKTGALSIDMEELMSDTQKAAVAAANASGNEEEVEP